MRLRVLSYYFYFIISPYGFSSYFPRSAAFLRCFSAWFLPFARKISDTPLSTRFAFYTVLNNAPFFKNLPLYIARQRPSARFRRVKKPDRKALSLSFCLFSIPYSSF